MGGVRRAVGLEHVLGVAVVGGDDAGPTRFVHGRDHASQAPVDRLDRLDRRRDRSGVTDHVGVREVDDPEAEAAPRPLRAELVGGLRRAHLRLEVVGRNVARRVGQTALLPLPLRLATAVEEVGDVGVLLGLGDVELPAAGRADHLGHRRLRRARRERDRVLPSRPVAGHRRDVEPRVPAALEPVEAGLAERRDQLAHPVRAEVERDHDVAGLHPVVVADHGRLDELVGVAGVVGVGDRLGGGRRARALGRGRARRRRASSAPSGGRGPSRSSGRRPCRSGRRCAASARPPRCSAAPPDGLVSRPSVNACRTRSGTPSRAASSMHASMCSQPEWTPPSETSPSRWSRPRGLERARSQAATRTSFSKKLPSAIASSIRARSCLTTEPAPRFR